MTGTATPAPWNISEQDPTDKRFLLVHNCYTTKTFRIEKKLAGVPLGKGASPQWIRFLEAEKLLVAPERVLPLILEKLFQSMNGFHGNRVTAAFLPTDVCQFACVYCVNDQVRKPGSKKRMDADKVAGKFIKHYRNTPAQFWRMVVTGGGEPLMAADYLADIGGNIQEAAGKLGRDFEMSIVSNGAAFTKKKLSRLINAGLYGFVITIDPEHDKTRPLTSGKGSLDMVMKGIEITPNEISLNITSNVYTGEVKKFRKLLKTLKPLKDRISGIGISTIMDKVPSKLQKVEAKFSRHFTNEHIDTIIACMEAVEEEGFRRDGSRMPLINCETFMASEHCFYNYAGESFICPGLDNVPEYSQKGRSLEHLRELFDMRVNNPQWQEHCFNGGKPCAYLTKCWGGCRMISVTSGNGWETINCEKPMYERLTRYELTNWT